LQTKKGFDFSGYHQTMLERCINRRLLVTKTSDFAQYYRYLLDNQVEVDNLIDVLTINVSKFFRNPLVFEFISAKLLPPIIAEKLRNKDLFLRVWSAGCACGEEPYSLAIIFKEFLEKESIKFDLKIFATDINIKSLQQAQRGEYNFESIKEVKHGLLKKYFIPKNDQYRIIPEIKEMVNFSVYDLLEEKSYAPPSSIFGSFDIVFCRNVLIYFNLECQEKILKKLYRSVVPNGYIILGEAETVPKQYEKYLERLSIFYKIYRKLNYHNNGGKINLK